MAEMARRAGGEIERVAAPWGAPLDPAAVRAACERHEPDVVGFVHAETSTGALQPDVPALAEAAHDHGALVVADTVTSLGGVELRVDEWGIDVAYSAAQKCLSCPPGASPLTVSDRAMAKVEAREAPVRSWYLDLSELRDYWGSEHAYHHTAPITNVYALREALRLAAEEGIEVRWARHERVAGALRAGLLAIGLAPVADESWWLPSLTTVRLPDEADPSAAIEHMLDAGVEVAGGLGNLAGEVLRIGCMGHGARRANVLETLAALGDALDAQGVTVDTAAGLAAARSTAGPDD
jgi:alanine-glyoxylate transaminase/serine-glyoxylate transaminase/serine-pyruvate transaminase